MYILFPQASNSKSRWKTHGNQKRKNNPKKMEIPMNKPYNSWIFMGYNPQESQGWTQQIPFYSAVLDPEIKV